MNDSPFDYGLGIHDNVPGSGFPFDFQPEGIDSLVDPGLSLSPYATTTPDSHFTTPLSVPLLSPGSSIECFGDHRSSIGSLDSTIAPHEIIASTAAKSSHHSNTNSSGSGSNSKPSKTAPSTASATATATMMTRTRKAAAQNVEASTSEAQPRAKRQKTASSAQAATIKQELQQEPPPPPPSRGRRLARRGAAAKKEDAAQRSKNLERNRIAASKCRQKKKEWVLELEETKSGMELRHNSLRVEYFQLLDEVTRIKNQLMAHAACNDPNINFWIEKEALRYVERCMDPPSERRPSAAANGEFAW
ncbi:transcriptional regulator family: bZIP [Trichoderma aggressivum f. europaeum]|uniref:Transcriptional regulator family: bZIP n=1 Tax=Trichoderma aggressivum f. europaeum TaxID=173218 RepID=A0AAE1ILI3_9HYPO|nr:transcriptional regulator family: bZIP [Trichoderma aggressivum f. europaeum]